MVPTVISNDMPGAGESAHDLWLLLDESPQHKERSLHRMTLEHFEESHCPGIVGAVIVGERDVRRARVQANEGTPVDLRSRPHGLEAGPGCGSGNRDSAESFYEHLRRF